MRSTPDRKSTRLNSSHMSACKLADIPYSSSFRPLMPLLGAMIFALALITFFPPLVTFLPNLIMGGSGG